MRKLLLVVAICLMAVPLAMAVDIACPTGTNWQTYLNFNGSGTTCHIGNLDFSGFSYSTAGTNQKAASTITVDTLTTPGNEGFDFNPAINLAGMNLNTDVRFDFDVKTLNGLPLINDLDIFFNGAFALTGSTSFSETQTGGVCTPSCASIQVTNPPPNLSKHVVFDTPVSSLHIIKDVIADTGSNGQASISDVQNRFSQVPEPRLISILMIGLLAGFGLSKKFKSFVVS
jgi:hypothetical protein